MHCNSCEYFVDCSTLEMVFEDRAVVGAPAKQRPAIKNSLRNVCDILTIGMNRNRLHLYKKSSCACVTINTDL